MPPDEAIGKSLEARVNSFVEWLFDGYKGRIPRESKVVNDPILGNQYFAKHEVAVIDSPLLQRLKSIKQTGLVYHVFPSATHSRFEHCLGVATIAERCFNAISERASVESGTLLVNPDRTRGDLAHLRMAALLHDVGHGLCSHASEQIYAFLTDLREFENQPKFARNAAGEILSYLIVKSQTFQGWFQKHVVEGCQANIDLETVGQMILGKHDDNDRHFLAQIVSSPYDADKLDYIARDSYYCGLALTVDLARFYSMIATAKMAGHRILVLRNYVPLEQILFSKMTLFGSVYHHQKVKCLDSMLRSLIQHIVENPSQCAVVVKGGSKISFSEPVQYLYVTDGEFFSQLDGFGDSYVKEMLTRFKRRDLFVRCLEISRRTVKNWEDYARRQFVKLSALPHDLLTVERKIHEQLPGDVRTACALPDVLISVPTSPSLKSGHAFIQTSRRAPIESHWCPN